MAIVVPGGGVSRGYQTLAGKLVELRHGTGREPDDREGNGAAKRTPGGLFPVAETGFTEN